MIATKFYEVILDNCDGKRAVIHVHDDGSISHVSGQKNWRTLLWAFNDPEAPPWVSAILRPKFSIDEFFRQHALNMQRKVPFKDLPFYVWLTEQKDPPGRFADALFGYYEGHPIKGAFSDGELDSYRHIYNQFWYDRNRVQRTT